MALRFFEQNFCIKFTNSLRTYDQHFGRLLDTNFHSIALKNPESFLKPKTAEAPLLSRSSAFVENLGNG